MDRVTIIDYGSGNLHSAVKASNERRAKVDRARRLFSPTNPMSSPQPIGSCCPASVHSRIAIVAYTPSRACATR